MGLIGGPDAGTHLQLSEPHPPEGYFPGQLGAAAAGVTGLSNFELKGRGFGVSAGAGREGEGARFGLLVEDLCTENL